MNFFDGLLLILCLGWEVKNYMNDQYNDYLGVCNVKIKKSLPGQKWGTFSIIGL